MIAKGKFDKISQEYSHDL